MSQLSQLYNVPSMIVYLQGSGQFLSYLVYSIHYVSKGSHVWFRIKFIVLFEKLQGLLWHFNVNIFN